MSAFKPTAAVVTGSGSGLGRAIALELASRGARVVVSDVVAEGAEETVMLIRAAGGTAHAIACDVRDAEQVQALHDQAVEAIGALDVWVNNAGVAVAGDVGAVKLEDWHWVVDVNTWGMVYGCHVVAPVFAAAGRGVIINVASAAGLLSTPGMAPYNVSKAAVVSLSETLYGELKSKGVGVTVVCPTFFVTNLLDTARGAQNQTKLASKLMRRSKVQAPDVARRALDDAFAGRLYSVAMRDGRMMWRLRRALPQSFYDLLSRGTKAVASRQA